MKVLERIDLLDKVGRELQARMTFSEIDVYLAAHGVDCKGFQPSANSKRVYVKEVLADSSEELILTIANELEIEHNFSIAPKEARFWKPTYFRLFLSHLANFKLNATRLQEELKKYGISSFVAHEDIEPSKEWQVEIEAALHTMDALSALIMQGFKESNWCDQEIGFAVARDVLIIPVRKGLDPYGFIGKYQGIQAKGKNIGEVAHETFTTIINSPKTRAKMLRCLVNTIGQSTEEGEAINKLDILKSVKNIPWDNLNQLRQNVLDNKALLRSEAFLAQLNVLLASADIQAVQIGVEVRQEEWDEIPF